jgi:guanosine-3',5'-bis(diphosphate) 3'-pyrophosphohydrolase
MRTHPVRAGRISDVETFIRWHDWAAAEPEVREMLRPATAEAVARAVRFATTWHGDQRRPTGVPYLEHLLEALEILVRGAEERDADVLCAAVLHDVLEDTRCTAADLVDQFGSRVAHLVGWVTKPEAQPGEDKDTVKEAYLRELRRAPRDAVLVKLADRASNVQTLRNLAPEKQRSYYAQTVTYIVPLAAAHPWFDRWYAQWQAEFADLSPRG